MSIRNTKITAYVATVLLVGLGPFAGTAFAAPAPGAEQQASDRAAILNTVAGAVFAFDNGDGKAFASYFAPDGEFVVDDPARPLDIKGTAALAKIGEPPAGAAPAGAPPPPMGKHHHVVSNQYVSFKDATHANFYGYYTLVVSEGGNVAVHDFGGYASSLVKIDGQWLFSTDRVVFGPIKPN